MDRHDFVRWFSILSLATSCGTKATETSGDAGVDATVYGDSDGSGDSGLIVGDSSPPPFVYVDGGSTCDAAPVVSPNHESRTCCNDQLCAGQCVLFADASAPVCYCVGQSGGCPEPMICCVRDNECKNAGTCTGGL